MEVEQITKDRDLNITISRAKFEEISAHLFMKVLDPVEKVLEDA